MKKTLDVFCEIPCLTERSALLNGSSLQKKWFKNADKRIIAQYLQKFTAYNADLFHFLGITPVILGTDQNIALAFRSSEFIGSIPLRSSDNGTQIGDFIVTPRFSGNNRFEDYIEILNLLGAEISPQIIDSLPLASGTIFRPPLYLEAIRFISALETLLKTSWKKFDQIEKTENAPNGNTNWTKYSNNEFKIENKLKFPNRKNILSEFHQEYAEIRYTYDLCRRELLSSNTPSKTKNAIKSKLAFIDEKMYLHKACETTYLKIKTSDSLAVKSCKEIGNKILLFKLTDCTAWRVNFSDVFEKFVQYIFKEVSHETGARLFSNFKIPSKGQHLFSWELKHLEPDAIYQKDNSLIFIDAKYKSNLYNKHSLSEDLKNEYRHDLHQILAYSSFSSTKIKYGFLCYPSDNIEIKQTKFNNSINGVDNIIFICGIPLKKEKIKDVKNLIIDTLSRSPNINKL